MAYDFKLPDIGEGVVEGEIVKWLVKEGDLLRQDQPMVEIMTDKATPFEFAFENYTALGYGDSVPAEDKRLLGPITALNGLLLIGWSVAILFEVMRVEAAPASSSGASERVGA